jgi:DNA polymerase-3 subunit gamma/tau
MPVLARVWQMLLKGIDEVQTAPSAKQAAEMVLVRLAYVADLPVPAELVKSVTTGEIPAAPVSMPPVSAPAALPASTPPVPVMPRRIESSGGSAASAMIAPEPEPPPEPFVLPSSGPQFDPMPQSFAETIELFAKRSELITRAQLRSQAHLVAFEPGHIEFRPAEGAPRDLASRLGQRLSEWTGTRWVVAVSQEQGAATLDQQQQARASELESAVAEHPLVKAVLDAFPGATIAAVRERFAATEPPVAGEIGGGDDLPSTDEDEP